MDGSYAKPSDSVYLCGYAVVSDTGEVIEAFALKYNSAQAAELITLKMFTLNFVKTWEAWDFKTTDGKSFSFKNS